MSEKVRSARAERFYDRPKINRLHILIALLLLFHASGCQNNDPKANAGVDVQPDASIEMVQDQGKEAVYEPTWESLSNYSAPSWYEDAKFGIFIHWGVYSAAGLGEWIGRHMYEKNHPLQFAYHVLHGSPQTHGYKDLVPKFTGARWDPEAWMDLFAASGARFVVPVAVHHDGFAMYDTELTRWNSVDMGPRRDVIGEIKQAAAARGLKFGVSSHLAWNWEFFRFNHENRYDVYNHPETWDLYNAPPGDAPSEAWVKEWYDRTIELIDAYQPDLLWFDFCFNPPEFEQKRQQVCAYYYNQGIARGVGAPGAPGVVLNYKGQAFPDGAAVLDIERGLLDHIRPMVWQTDTSISKWSWGYALVDDFKSPNALIDGLIDIVSKNGVLLLNVGPKADGTIPLAEQCILRAMGAWLKVGGEAIYNTRPWVIYGEGPTKVSNDEYNADVNRFVAEDIRFTRNKANSVLYATCLDWPGNGATLHVTTLKAGAFEAGSITRISLLGSNAGITWQQDETGLHIACPSRRPCGFAHAFKIEFTGAIPALTAGGA